MNQEIDVAGIRKVCRYESIPRLVELFREYNGDLVDIARDKKSTKNNFYYILTWLDEIDLALRQKPKELLEQGKFELEEYLAEQDVDQVVGTFASNNPREFAKIQNIIYILDKYIQNSYHKRW